MRLSWDCATRISSLSAHVLIGSAERGQLWSPCRLPAPASFSIPSPPHPGPRLHSKFRLSWPASPSSAAPPPTPHWALAGRPPRLSSAAEAARPQSCQPPAALPLSPRPLSTPPSPRNALGSRSYRLAVPVTCLTLVPLAPSNLYIKWSRLKHPVIVACSDLRPTEPASDSPH